MHLKIYLFSLIKLLNSKSISLYYNITIIILQDSNLLIMSPFIISKSAGTVEEQTKML